MYDDTPRRQFSERCRSQIAEHRGAHVGVADAIPRSKDAIAGHLCKADTQQASIRWGSAAFVVGRLHAIDSESLATRKGNASIRKGFLLVQQQVRNDSPRATNAFEPGQGRKTAALRRIVRVPRGRLWGATGRLNASFRMFEEGCAVN